MLLWNDLSGIPTHIKEKWARNLYTIKNHPLYYIKNRIYKAIPEFEVFENEPKIVSVQNNFDDLLIPTDHPSRNKSDTYYISETEVLRTHTSAHQSTLLKDAPKNTNYKFVVTGDVYRRDEIDRFHFPIFHQMEGVSIGPNVTETDLKDTISKIVKELFGNIEYRFVDSYFPFTAPSWELEINWNGEWLEIAGMGMVQKQILDNCEVEVPGFAFGLGLERLAMILYEIPDIRLFWSNDARFLSQFEDGPAKFKPYSKYPSCYKDIAFWTPEGYTHNDFYDLVREFDWVESIKLIDTFIKPGKGTSYCYRINFQSMDKTLINDDINNILEQIKTKTTDQLKIQVR